MKNILYVFGAEKASGAENVILRLIEANTASVNPHIFLAPGNFATMLIKSKAYVFNENITLRPQLKKLNRSRVNKIQFFFIALSNYISNSYAVAMYIRRNNIDVVHANTIVPAFYLVPAIIYSKLFLKDIKWVWSDHDLKYFSSIDYSLSRICVKFYNLTFAVSKAVKEKFASDSSVVVLHNGFAISNELSLTDKYTPIRLTLNIPDDYIVIGIAASIIRRKGILELVAVFKALNKQKNNIKLLIAGHLSVDEPEYEASFLREIENDDNISYLGSVSNMDEFYNTCDIIVNNSLKDGSEPLGTTIIEAMAHGKITVASDTGGTPEIITDGKDGFLFPADDFDRLRERLSYCLDNKQNLDFIRINAHKKISTSFNIRGMVDSYNEYVNSLYS